MCPLRKRNLLLMRTHFLTLVNPEILQMNRLQKQFVTQNQDLLGKEFLEGKEPQRHDDDEEPLG